MSKTINNRRININVGTELVAELDEVAQKMCMTRTDLIILAINQFLDQRKAISFLGSADVQKLLALADTLDQTKKS